MISREDFVFTIGFSGSTAIVDARKRRYARLDTRALAERGLFKAALCSAVYAGSGEELELVLEIYNRGSVHPVESVEHLQRLFGVFEVPEGIGRSRSL